MEPLLGCAGLDNLGNTCFMNSAIQCLSNCVEFKNYLVSEDFINDISIDTEEKEKCILSLQKNMSFQLRRLLSYFWTYDCNEHTSWKPSSFRSIFCKKLEFFQNTLQHDSQEALLCMLDTFNEEIGKKVIIQKNETHIDRCFKYLKENELDELLIKKIKKYPNEYLNFLAFESFKNFHSRKYSKIASLFGGMIISQITCPETNIPSANFEPFYMLSLSIPENDDDDFYGTMYDYNSNSEEESTEETLSEDEITLYDCLDNFIEEEKLDDDNKWFSPYARKHVNARKKILLWDIPDILIIHLKRFKKNEYSFSKKNDLIDFPIENLDLNKYIHSNNRYKNYKYNLFAINNHTSFNGIGISFGHYFSYCKNELNNKWYDYDDDTVTEIELDDLVTKNAYILFYRRVIDDN